MFLSDVLSVFRDLSTDNLHFLSSRQALADLAHFRTVMGETRGLANSQWVAFGGSYSGSLAAWFRLKYPHLVHASVATSAPVYATVNFPGMRRHSSATICLFSLLHGWMKVSLLPTTENEVRAIMFLLVYEWDCLFELLVK